MMLSITRMNYFIFILVLLNFKDILALGETCTKNSDCSTTNSVCLEKKCACDDLSYLSATQCLSFATEYSATCYENAQCEWLGSNSGCVHNRCVCLENFRWYQGKCQQYADKNGPCVNDGQCYNGYDMLSLTCAEDTCECSTNNYYDRGYDCRKKSGAGGECALTQDCQSPSLECVLGKCSNSSTETEENNFEILHKQVQPNVEKLIYGKDTISCENDGDCVDMANSQCDISTKVCGCNEDTHYLYNGNCVQGLSHCSSDTDCTDISNNTHCFKSTSCICQPGFFLKNKECLAELGMQDPNKIISKDSDCPVKPGQAIDSICYCKSYWFNDALNRNCIKTMIASTQRCITNEWCAAMGPYSFCNSTTSLCQCSSIATFNETTYYCDLSSNNKVDCLRDIECNLNERCVDEKCICLENFSKSNGDICIPNIGASCSGATSCSHIDNSNCVGGTCKCDNDYVGKETKCLKIADSLEAPCEEQEQCQNLEHAVCGVSEVEYVTNEYNDTLRCICEEGYTDVNELCHQIKKYGDPCMTEAECTTVLNRSYKCRNSQCQCDVGYTLKNGYCTSGSNVVVASSLLLFALLISWVCVN